MKKNIFLYIMAGLAVISCNNTSTTPGVSTLDSVETVLEDAAGAFKEVDQEEMQEQKQKADRYYELITANYRDYSNKDFWTHEINMLTRARKAFGKYNAAGQDLDEKMAYNKKQLNDLRTAYEKGNMSEDEFRTHLREESEAIGNYANKVTYIAGETNFCIRALDSLSPKYDSLINTLSISPAP